MSTEKNGSREFCCGHSWRGFPCFRFVNEAPAADRLLKSFEKSPVPHLKKSVFCRRAEGGFGVFSRIFGFVFPVVYIAVPAHFQASADMDSWLLQFPVSPFIQEAFFAVGHSTSHFLRELMIGKRISSLLKKCRRFRLAFQNSPFDRTCVLGQKRNTSVEFYLLSADWDWISSDLLNSILKSRYSNRTSPLFFVLLFPCLRLPVYMLHRSSSFFRPAFHKVGHVSSTLTLRKENGSVC